ncbi:hypothetical protein ACFQU7_24825 [Pseudoroseomonas wenyumeiae]
MGAGPGAEIARPGGAQTAYYEHWLAALEHLVAEKGILDAPSCAGARNGARRPKPLRMASRSYCVETARFLAEGTGRLSAPGAPRRPGSAHPAAACRSGRGGWPRRSSACAAG